MPRRETAEAVLPTLPTSSPTAMTGAIETIAQTETVAREIRAASIKAPMGEIGSGYVSDHVEARLGPQQAKSMKSLVAGLIDVREKLENGREVRTSADAVRWMLEKLSDSD